MDLIWKLYPENSKDGIGRGAKIYSHKEIPRIMESIERDLVQWMAGIDELPPHLRETKEFK